MLDVLHIALKHASIIIHLADQSLPQMEILLSSVVHDNTHVQQQTRGLLPETCPCYYTWDIVVAAMSQGPGYYVCIHREKAVL